MIFIKDQSESADAGTVIVNGTHHSPEVGVQIVGSKFYILEFLVDHPSRNETFLFLYVFHFGLAIQDYFQRLLVFQNLTIH